MERSFVAGCGDWHTQISTGCHDALSLGSLFTCTCDESCDVDGGQPAEEKRCARLWRLMRLKTNHLRDTAVRFFFFLRRSKVGEFFGPQRHELRDRGTRSLLSCVLTRRASPMCVLFSNPAWPGKSNFVRTLRDRTYPLGKFHKEIREQLSALHICHRTTS